MSVDVTTIVLAIEEGGLSFILFAVMIVAIFIVFLISMAR